MPVYQDKTTNTWYCKFYYADWTGKRKQKLKRGFKLQREAKDWERQFLEQHTKDPTITFQTLYERFKEYNEPRTRKSTTSSLFCQAEKHILPYFKDMVISDITQSEIVAWQNEMLKKNLSSSYTRHINRCLSSIFLYAVNYVGLPKNPCSMTKSIGSTQTRKLNFWTPEEYKLFSKACEDDIEYFTIFEVLYYTGMRVGELLALTLNDVDLVSNKISITKTYWNNNGVDIVTPPKTRNSERTVDIPVFLTDEIKEYISHLYEPTPETRLFPKKQGQILMQLKKAAKKSGVKEIRVHDIRHSHASMLINAGANPVLVSERLGHESPDITLKTYSHLFPHKQAEIIAKIEKL